MMTKEEAVLALVELQDMTDIEKGHAKADEILCKLLDSLGYSDVVSEYVKISKWYA